MWYVLNWFDIPQAYNLKIALATTSTIIMIYAEFSLCTEFEGYIVFLNKYQVTNKNTYTKKHLFFVIVVH